MSAITEMPAKTAKPMGKTDNEVPGSLNAAESAAAVPDGEVDEDDAEEGCPCELGLAPAPLAGLTVEGSVAEVEEAIEVDEVAEAGKLVDDDAVSGVAELVDDEGAAEGEVDDAPPVEDACKHVVQNHTTVLVF
jgi:hypothetical protein